MTFNNFKHLTTQNMGGVVFHDIEVLGLGCTYFVIVE